MKIWGYWATLGWAALAFLAGQFVGFGVLFWLRAGTWIRSCKRRMTASSSRSFILISNPVTIGVLMFAVSAARRADQADYFALHWPRSARCDARRSSASSA